MFKRIRRAIRDMRTIKLICYGAEKHALADGTREPGAEHFLLTALDLPDGTAQRAFAKVNADPSDMKEAIARQYDDALRSIGVDPDTANAAASAAALPEGGTRLYCAAPSGQEVMQALWARRKQDGPYMPLLGAHIVDVVCAMPHGVAARSLRALGIEPHLLAEAAKAEIAATALAGH